MNSARPPERHWPGIVGRQRLAFGVFLLRVRGRTGRTGAAATRLLTNTGPKVMTKLTGRVQMAPCRAVKHRRAILVVRESLHPSGRRSPGRAAHLHAHLEHCDDVVGAELRHPQHRRPQRRSHRPVPAEAPQPNCGAQAQRNPMWTSAPHGSGSGHVPSVLAAVARATSNQDKHAEEGNPSTARFFRRRHGQNLVDGGYRLGCNVSALASGRPSTQRCSGSARRSVTDF
jgi:hypothetical protein